MYFKPKEQKCLEPTSFRLPVPRLYLLPVHDSLWSLHFQIQNGLAASSQLLPVWVLLGQQTGQWDGAISILKIQRTNYS